MKYTVSITNNAEKDLKRLDKYTRTLIKQWILTRLEGCENPRAFGKALTANHKGKWRYRIGDYRLICHIDDGEIVILILQIGHRRDIYD